MINYFLFLSLIIERRCRGNRADVVTSMRVIPRSPTACTDSSIPKIEQRFQACCSYEMTSNYSRCACVVRGTVSQSRRTASHYHLENHSLFLTVQRTQGVLCLQGSTLEHDLFVKFNFTCSCSLLNLSHKAADLSDSSLARPLLTSSENVPVANPLEIR